jgi:lycopene cyclase domain-containing protein
MTYLGFHLRFTVPALVLSLGLLLSSNLPLQTWSSIAVVLTVLFALVVAFTSPWDNIAVKRGTWDFPSDRVWFRIYYLPVEEYAFFLLQTAIVSFLVIGLLWYSGGFSSIGHIALAETIASAAFLLIWFASGWLYRRCYQMPRRLTYAWHLLFWFLPVIGVQWIIASEVLLPNIGILALSTAVVGTYLTLADVVAVRRGIWFFDDSQITGFRFFRVLPWEEAAFFYITSALVAQSTLLLLPPF